ncbi:hypothetical protein [Fibrobacter sp.]|uniref:hypothetical protein n=1 Tax=Fibrobacter sp. TaxID=35828 RepID=UPI003863705C
MGIAEFWQRQRLIDSGIIRPRTLRPKKRKKGRYEIETQEIDKQSPDVQKKILDVMEIQSILFHAQSDLRDYMKSSESGNSTTSIENQELHNFVCDFNDLIIRKCKLFDKMKKKIFDEAVQKMIDEKV